MHLLYNIHITCMFLRRLKMASFCGFVVVNKNRRNFTSVNLKSEIKVPGGHLEVTKSNNSLLW